MKNSTIIDESNEMFDQLKQTYSRHVLLRRLLFGVAGALIGFSYYHFIGCHNGRCAITGSPVISTLYGAVVGVLIPRKNI